ncbi:hypothetical protein [Saccharibacillus kuerlensis]|uniref:Uncharacterized protein n=1 Tax=Saccharibacillus kuerlensis TaxID=459527 RepID=A0ABQ2KXG1_9BACL|nr:hypothetical protein [Saccharibacillus kuerlensis]GGN95775.1 hypothetical protein GCM10010969_11980 [Saccharibacillus kuerlensis]
MKKQLAKFVVMFGVFAVITASTALTSSSAVGTIELTGEAQFFEISGVAGGTSGIGAW